jgi:hypothetical protein
MYSMYVCIVSRKKITLSSTFYFKCVSTRLFQSSHYQFNSSIQEFFSSSSIISYWRFALSRLFCSNSFMWKHCNNGIHLPLIHKLKLSLPFHINTQKRSQILNEFISYDSFLSATNFYNVVSSKTYPLSYWRGSSLISTLQYFLFQWIMHNKNGLDDWDITWDEFDWRESAFHILLLDMFCFVS